MPSSPGTPGVLSRHRIGLGAAVAVVIVALTVTVVIGMMRTRSEPAQAVRISTPAATGTPRSAATPGRGVFVHVAGAVRSPGLYELPSGARLVDAVAAAGGFAADAARDGVNLARPVADGEQIIVPKPGDPPAVVPGAGAASGPGAATQPGGRVNLNTADQATLETLPRIGPALAGRILQWRDKNGSFTSVDDLMAVSGIGPKLMESLRDLVTV